MKKIIFCLLVVGLLILSGCGSKTTGSSILNTPEIVSSGAVQSSPDCTCGCNKPAASCGCPTAQKILNK